MEVASPLAFVAPSGGTKRALACSPHMMDTTIQSNTPEEDLFQRAHKRRRFHADTSVDSLSSAFAAPSTFFNNSLQSKQGLGSPFGRFPHVVRRVSSDGPQKKEWHCGFRCT